MSFVSTDGDLLQQAVDAAYINHYGYPAGTHVPAEIWADAAAEFWRLRYKVRFGVDVANGRVVTLGRDWRDELKKYGRHLPGCPTGAPCNCGFAEIEKELAA